LNAEPHKLQRRHGEDQARPDGNTAYSINFDEPFDEMLIHQIPAEAIVIYGGANASAGLYPFWRRSPAVPSRETSLLLSIDQLYGAEQA